MRAAPLALLAAALATPAAALTCAPPDPVQSFRAAHAAPESYVILHGRLDVDPARLPDASQVRPGMGETRLPPVEARFSGMALGLSGFSQPVDATILLEVTCLGPWCGSIGPGDDWLLFARPSGSGRYRLAVDACGMWAFDRPSAAALDAVAECLAAGGC